MAERSNKLSSIVTEGREAPSSGEGPDDMHKMLAALVPPTPSEPERNNRLATYAKVRSIWTLT